MDDNGKKVMCTVNVHLGKVEREKMPDAMVYAYDAKGNFLASEVVPKRADAKVVLELPERLVDKNVQVFVGPAVPQEKDYTPQWAAKLVGEEGADKAPSPLYLERREASVKKLVLKPKESILDIAIKPKDWAKWLMCPCVIKGRMIKKVLLSDGTVKEWGVCHACVSIYEVDKIPKMIFKLPDRYLYKLRDDLLKKWKDPLPYPPKIIPIPPEPPPEFLHVAKFVQPMEMKVAEARAMVATPIIPLPPPETGTMLISGELPPMNKLKAEFKPIFEAQTAKELRAEMVAKYELIYPYLCGIDWLHYWLHSDWIGCACTDNQGYFTKTIWYRCAGDKPDLYFKVYQCPGGHKIYDPGMLCHTHWNYDCGTEITLITDDPAAITCVPSDPVDPPPGVTSWVMPFKVGDIPLNQIKPYWVKVGGVWKKVTTPDAKVGLTTLTDYNGTWSNIPFGSTLGFRHGYSGEMPINLPGKPYYYRWEFNKLDEDGNPTGWHDYAAPVAQTVVRHYVDEDLAIPDQPPTFPVFTLGPHEVNGMHLYMFKPHEPPTKVGHVTQWPVDDWFGDIYTGIMLSNNLPGGVLSAAGKYKIRLSVYDPSGTIIIPGAGTFKFIVPIGVAADGVTTNARAAKAAEIEDGGFVFTIHIDNNPCSAEIYQTKVNDVQAGDCGFIPYHAADSVKLSFKANHPNGYARFKFNLFKGSTGSVEAGCAPWPYGVTYANAPLVTDTPVNGFERDAASIYTKLVANGLLRGTCSKAAFGENLYVAAAITNGWSRLAWLDASGAPMAFALEPVP